jgi:predicted Zn-ribbon and HTH transcriptional regulator
MVMGERIDQFCENLRIKLTSIDNNMQELKAKIDSKAQTAEQEVRTQLETVKKRIEQDRTKLETAQADVKKCGSASSTVRTTRKSSSCACTPKS